MSADYVLESIKQSGDYIKKEVSRVAEQFLWEEFSADEKDRGIEVKIEYHNKMLPFRVKRALTIDERQRANDAAIKIELDKSGKPRITKQDQAAFTKEIVLVGLKFWPFEYHAGKPVPINRETVSVLDGGLLDQIASHILGIAEVDKAELDPFERKSDAA